MSERVFITIPLFLTEKPHTKTAITLPELVRETNAFSKKYRPGCSPKLLDSNPKALFLHYNVKCNKEDSDPSGHDVRIQFDVTHVAESQQAKDLDVQVSCSCPAFLYWGAQWNLHQRDGLLGTPRPELVAPTERLDLRGNFVICKHIHAVFERILPSVQHNIVKILREREVQKNKQKMKETPERLKDKQDEMKRKREEEKIRKEKDKDVQDAMIDALKEEEENRLLHQQQLDNQGAPGPVEEESLPADKVTEVPSGDEDIHALEELAKGEEKKIQEQHQKHVPHMHSGLPYEIHTPGHNKDEQVETYEVDTGHGISRQKLTPEEARKMKGKGWKGERVSAKLPSLKPEPGQLKPGDRVCFDVKPSATGVVVAVHGPNVTVKWDEEKHGQFDVSIERLRYADQPRLFNEFDVWRKETPIIASIGTLAKIAMRFNEIKKGMRVVYIPTLTQKRMEGTVTRIGKLSPTNLGAVNHEPVFTVKWDEGHESTVAAWTLGNLQKGLDFGLFNDSITAAVKGIPYSELRIGDRVTKQDEYPSDKGIIPRALFGTVQNKNTKVTYDAVAVRWDEAWWFDGADVNPMFRWKKIEDFKPFTAKEYPAALRYPQNIGAPARQKQLFSAKKDWV